MFLRYMSSFLVTVNQLVTSYFVASSASTEHHLAFNFELEVTTTAVSRTMVCVTLKLLLSPFPFHLCSHLWFQVSNAPTKPRKPHNFFNVFGAERVGGSVRITGLRPYRHWHHTVFFISGTPIFSFSFPSRTSSISNLSILHPVPPVRVVRLALHFV